MADSSADGGTRSWWQTLPGMLTAAAALISAVTGLVVAVRQLRSDDNGSSEPPGAATAVRGGASRGQTVNGESDIVPNTRTYAVTFPRGAIARVGENRYQVLRARATGGNPGEIELALRVRMANDSPYDANFWSRTFRLRVGTETSAPTNFLDELVAGGTTKVGDVDFTVGAAARRATLLVGDDPHKPIALPLRLSPRS